MEPRRKRCLQGAAGDLVQNVLIKQEVEWPADEFHPGDLVCPGEVLDLEPLSSIKFEKGVRSINTETVRKRSPKGAMPNVLIKKKLKWLEEDTHASDLASQDVIVNMASLRSIKTEEGSSYTDIEAHLEQQFTPVPQTDGFIKTELILDEEFRDEIIDSEAHRKQSVVAQADDLDSNSGSSTQGNNQRTLSSAHGQRDRASISYKEREPRKFSSHSDSRKRLRLEPSLKCEFCPRTFKQNCRLKSHLRTHAEDGKREFPCKLCEKTFSKKSSLASHKKVHTKRVPAKLKASSFNCEVCGATFAQRGNRNVHMVSKHLNKAASNAPGPQTADDDSIDTNTEEFLDEDAASFGQESIAQGSQSKSDIKTEACEVCHGIYPTEYMRAHMRLAHSKPKHKCEFCPRRFKQKCELKRHLRSHANDKKRKFACNSCDSTFYTRSTLWNHKKVHGRETHPCKVCGRDFTLKENLKFHMVRLQHFHQKEQITPHSPNDAGVAVKKEPVSDEEFIDEENGRDSVSHAEGGQQPTLATDNEQRARVSTAEDSVTCEVCRNSYPEELIETHMRITHADRGYKCPFCPQVCTRQTTLKNHISTHDNNRTRSYACEECGVTLLSKGSLKRHMISQHSQNGRAQFNCELCEKIFYTKNGLKAHELTHAGVTFSCEVCGKSFSRKQGLRNHIMRKHKAKTQTFTPDSQIATCNSVHTKVALISDEQFLKEETNLSSTQPFSPDSETAKDDSVHTKQEWT